MPDGLIPCPFCGGEVMRRDALWPSEGDRDAVIHAEPSDCPLRVFEDDTWGGSLYGRWNGGLMHDREKVAALMMRLGVATGHGDTIDELLGVLEFELSGSFKREYERGRDEGGGVYCMRPILFEHLREWFKAVTPNGIQVDGSVRLNCLLLPASRYMDEPEEVRNVTIYYASGL